jgi:sigma-B regulation protein RsbU (phosphoserine phosphatase)
MKAGGERGLEKKLTLILLAFALVISGTIGGIGYHTYMNSTFARYRHTAASVLKLARSFIDADDMKACLESGVKSKAYEETQAVLDGLKENLGVAYIYLFDVTAGGEVLYYITAVTRQERENIEAGEKINSLGGRDRFPDDVTRQLLKVGEASPLAEIVNRTQYGYMLSVYSPVKDSKREKIGLLGVDFDMNEINAELASYAVTVTLAAVAAAFSFAALLIFFIRRDVTRPIGVIAKKAGEFAAADHREGELAAIKLDIKQKDEIGVLASAFEKMTEDLVKYVTELAVTIMTRERIESELEVARNIQAGMLPSALPAFPERKEFEVFFSMTPAREVGGDFYDFFMTDESHLTLVIADVSGKGVPAALFMMVARTLVKKEARGEPNEILERVNGMLCEDNGACMFATVFIGVYDVKTGLLKYSSAGHNPPLVIKSGGEAGFLETSPSLVLAIDEAACYASREIVMEPGDTLLLYTDGVTEASNDKGEFFSEVRLARVPEFPALSCARGVIERVQDELRNFTRGAEQSDDITMLALVRRE